MKKALLWIACLLIPMSCSGCFLTKILTVPMRAVGAAVSIIPGPGDTMHDGIDELAEEIDEVPI